jgi:ubiquinone/menaquinone biosynthesis C-methylase UbiE
MAEDIEHPLFARIYMRFADAAERKGAGEHRQEMLAGLEGRVIELGAGHGANFSHYPRGVTEVVAVEPEASLRAAAAREAETAPVPIRVVDGVADALPADDDSFDAGVASLVLCSVPDQATALAELRRVIRPGGELRFYEHVRAQSPGFFRFQRAVQPVWKRVNGGCHPTRDTGAAIEGAGFQVEEMRRFAFRPFIIVAPAAPHILGRARAPAGHT